MHGLWQRFHNGAQSHSSHARAHGGAAVRVLPVWEGLLRRKRVEAAHAEPLGGATVSLPDLPQDLHLSEPPEEAPEKPLKHELKQA